MKKNEKLETYEKYEEKYIFIGWNFIQDYDNYCIETKTKIINNKTHIYKTYKMLDGTIRKMKYISN